MHKRRTQNQPHFMHVKTHYYAFDICQRIYYYVKRSSYQIETCTERISDGHAMVVRPAPESTNKLRTGICRSLGRLALYESRVS